MDARKVGGTHYSRVVDELGHHKLGFGVVAPRGQVGEIRLPNGVEQAVAGNRDSPAEDEHLGVENGTQARAGLTQPASELTKGVQGPRIFVDEQARQNVAREATSALALDGQLQTDSAGVSDFVGHPQQRAARPVLLDAAACAAPTRQAIGHDAQVP